MTVQRHRRASALPPARRRPYDPPVDEAFGEMLDTDERQRKRYYELLRGLSPEQRARKAAALSSSTRSAALDALRTARPEASPSELAVLLAERLYGAAHTERLRRAIVAAPR